MPGFELFGDKEKKEVMDVLDTGVLFRYGFEQARKGIWKAKSFEKSLCRFTGAGFAHLCSSGTAALSIALAACGIGAGDEVIIPPFTFVATFEAVLNAGAIPVFGEIDETLCLNPDRLDAVVTEKTKAVIPVHMCGAMARIDQIKNFCTANGLILIEDACQAIGGFFKGKHLGRFGHMGCLSFDAVKTITCGEGGGIITDDDELYRRAFQYSDHGHDHLGGSDRGADNHPIMGANYRISELNAAVGLAQLGRLSEIIKIQKKNKKIIKDAISDLKDIEFRKIPDPDGDSASFLSFFLPDGARAGKVIKALGKNGIDACFYWYENNWHYFKRWDHLQSMKSAAPLCAGIAAAKPDYKNISLPESDSVMEKTISMLIKLSWTDSEIEKRIKGIKNAVNN